MCTCNTRIIEGVWCWLCYESCPMLGKNFWVFSISSNGGVFSVCVHTRKLTLHLHHTRHSCSVFTALWCGCFVGKLTFYLHQTLSWLWLVWNSWHNGTNNARTPPYYGHTSSPWTTGLYHIQCIDCIKMVDDHDVK